MGTIIRAVFAYWGLIVVVRAIGRRPGGQMTPFEFVLIFFIGGLSIQAVVADDRSVVNAFTAVATVALMHVLVTRIKQKFPAFESVVDGTPVLIFEKGEWRKERMARHGVKEADVMAAARAQGLEREDQIKYAVIERKGDISIIKLEQ